MYISMSCFRTIAIGYAPVAANLHRHDALRLSCRQIRVFGWVLDVKRVPQTLVDPRVTGPRAQHHHSKAKLFVLYFLRLTRSEFFLPPCIRQTYHDQFICRAQALPHKLLDCTERHALVMIYDLCGLTCAGVSRIVV